MADHPDDKIQAAAAKAAEFGWRVALEWAAQVAETVAAHLGTAEDEMGLSDDQQVAVRAALEGLALMFRRRAGTEPEAGADG